MITARNMTYDIGTSYNIATNFIWRNQKTPIRDVSSTPQHNVSFSQCYITVAFKKVP